MATTIRVIPGRPGFGALLWWFQGSSETSGDYFFELNGQTLPQRQATVVPVWNPLYLITGRPAENNKPSKDRTLSDLLHGRVDAAYSPIGGGIIKSNPSTTVNQLRKYSRCYSIISLLVNNLLV